MTHTIAKQEYQRRAGRLRTAMQAEGIDCLLIFSWKRGQVRYISGYHPNYIANVAMLVLPADAPPAMIIRFPFDLERARRESWIDHIEASGNVIEMAPIAAHHLRQSGLASGRVGLITGDGVIDEMSYRLYNLLISELPRVSFVNAGHLLTEARRVKSEAEFALLRESASLADTGAEAARNTLQAGRSEYEVVAAAEGAMRSLGADMHLVTVASKGITDSIGPPRMISLQAGSDVLVEVAVQHLGYMTQVARTFYVGGPTDGQASVYRATYKAYLAGVAAANPGTTCADLARVMQASLSMGGYADYMQHDLGHGIGIDLPEEPRIETGDRTVLEPGMALVIHPSIRIPGVGGAFLGGTVLIHGHGAEPIHQIPGDLH